MQTYLVRWEIEIDATTPDAAALEALSIMRDPDSLATVFEVAEHHNWQRVDPIEVEES